MNDDGCDTGGNSSYANDLLDLPGCETIWRDYLGRVLAVQAVYLRQLTRCPYCPSESIIFGDAQRTKRKYIWDIPRGLYSTLIRLFIPEVLCELCGRSIEMGTLPFLHPRHNMTQRLVDYILARAATMVSFSQIALDTGLELSTVINVFLDAFRAWDREIGMDLPTALRIDEVYCNGVYYTVLSDADTGACTDVLQGRTNAIIAARFKAAGNREQVEYLIMDFCDPFRQVCTRVLDPLPKIKRKFSAPTYPGVAEDEMNLPLFADLAQGTASQAVASGSSLSKREELRPLLPNVKVVGDHYHFKRFIVKGYNKIRLAVQKSLFRYYFRRERSRYGREQIILLGWEAVKAEIEAKARKLARQRETELKDNWRILDKRPSKIDFEEWSWLQQIFRDHPLLDKGWKAKNAGLEIFPCKPLLGRSEQSRKAAEQQRKAQLMTPAEAERRLDAWCQSIDKKVRPYFQKALDLIKHWRQEIIRIGTTGYDNAGAESKNRYLRLLQAMGRGMTFELLRARLLWADMYPRRSRWSDCGVDIKGRITPRKLMEYLDAIADPHSALS